MKLALALSQVKWGYKTKNSKWYSKEASNISMYYFESVMESNRPHPPNILAVPIAILENRSEYSYLEEISALNST